LKRRKGKKYSKCGRKSSKSKERYPLCRPLKRITRKTPKTVSELKLSSKNLKILKREKKSSKRVSFQRGGVMKKRIDFCIIL
jgi:hypothetical protein